MEQVSIGQSVKIKRTDGRVHAAVVSKLNNSAKSITVEWYERGETKGKEVELDAILALNPELLQDLTEQHAAPEPKKQATAPVSLSRNPTHSAIGGANRSTNRITMHSVSTTSTGGSVGVGIGTGVSGIGASSSVSSVLNEIMESNASAANSQASATTGIMRPRNSHATNASVASGTRIASAVNTNTSTMSGIGGGSTNTTTAERSTAGGNNTANNTTNTTAGSTVGARRSYVVKEVERLKENREKRRARQAEIKEEKVALMNQDPGNPNWETAQMIREYQNTLEFYPLIDGQVVEDHQITVCVRKRPLSRKEVGRKEIDVISVPRKDMLIVHEPRNKVDLTKFLEHHKFRFDYAFNEQCDNGMVYKYTAKPLVKTIFDGGMATCFAYGQTGSGKTHTMGGEFNGKVQDCKNGIYAMAAKDVFVLLNNPRYRSLNLVVSASFFEIYSGKVFDLLADKQKLRVLEDGKQQVQVVGLTEKVVDSVEEVLKLIQHGNNARTSGQTSANSNSSRSHAVFQIVLRPPGSAKIHGKFSFIDLAGNERGADTSSANRQTRMEGAEINKSLLALKECIRALGKQSSHLPFRVSKLTQVLRDSFIGEKSKTCMIAMISPGLSSCEHTLNTLRYADRVKELVVKESHDVLREEEEIMEEEDEEEDEEVENVGVQQQLQQNTQLTTQGQQQHRANVGGLGMQHNNHHNSHHHHNNNNNNNKNGPPTEMDLALLRSLSTQKSYGKQKAKSVGVAFDAVTFCKASSGAAKPTTSGDLTYRRSGSAGGVGGFSSLFGIGNGKCVTDIKQYVNHVDNDDDNNDDGAAGGGDERECGGSDEQQKNILPSSHAEQMNMLSDETKRLYERFTNKMKEIEDKNKVKIAQQQEQAQRDIEHDMSDELLVQHAAINDLQQTEEMVVDQHRTINDFLEHFLSESKSLYDLTNYVDYDQDAYCKRGEAMFTQLVDIAVVCRDMMGDYRAKLAKEEMLSCNFKPPNKR